jgi:L-fuconolactonase
MTDRVPRIDAHQHFWDPERGDYFWMEPESRLHRVFGPHDLQPSLAKHGIDGTVLVQAAPTRDETDYMLAIADATPSVLGVVGWIDFEDRLHSPALERLALHPKFKGVRPMIQDIADPKWVCHANLNWAFDMVAEFGLTFDALIYPEHVPFILKRLGRQPELRVVIDHGAKPIIRDRLFDDWAADITRIARDTSALVKLSGLVTEASADWSVDTLRPYTDHLLATFGPERIIWGSDWPVCLLAATYDVWMRTAEHLTAGCSPEQKAAIFGGNAVAFYGLAPKAA